MDPRDIVVVGAGEAGARVAIALREQGYDGDLTLIGEERHAPYERPPLSKAAIVDPEPPELPEIADARRLGRTRRRRRSRASRRPRSTGRAKRTVALADGRALRYEQARAGDRRAAARA